MRNDLAIVADNIEVRNVFVMWSGLRTESGAFCRQVQICGDLAEKLAGAYWDYWRVYCLPVPLMAHKKKPSKLFSKRKQTRLLYRHFGVFLGDSLQSAVAIRFYWTTTRAFIFAAAAGLPCKAKAREYHVDPKSLCAVNEKIGGKMEKTIFPLFETIAVEQGKILNISIKRDMSNKPILQENTVKNLWSFRSLAKKHRTLGEISPLVRCRIDYHARDYHIQCFPYQRKTCRTFQAGDWWWYWLWVEICWSCVPQWVVTAKKVTVMKSWLSNRVALLIVLSAIWFFVKVTNGLHRIQQPLLAGTQRALLLAQGKIQARRILLENVPHFEEIRLINALSGLKVS